VSGLRLVRGGKPARVAPPEFAAYLAELDAEARIEAEAEERRERDEKRLAVLAFLAAIALWVLA
jgi:hypothetical protein